MSIWQMLEGKGVQLQQSHRCSEMLHAWDWALKDDLRKTRTIHGASCSQRSGLTFELPNTGHLSALYTLKGHS